MLVSTLNCLPIVPSTIPALFPLHNPGIIFQESCVKIYLYSCNKTNLRIWKKHYFRVICSNIVESWKMKMSAWEIKERE